MTKRTRNLVLILVVNTYPYPSVTGPDVYKRQLVPPVFHDFYLKLKTARDIVDVDPDLEEINYDDPEDK